MNRAPVAVDDSARTNKGTAVTIQVLANDRDPDTDPMTIVTLSQPANGTTALNPDGTITYTPKPQFSSGMDTFTYSLTDGAALSNVATVTVTVVTPLTAGNDAATTSKNSRVDIAVLANDSGGDGHTLSVTALTQPLHGAVVLNSSGTVSYTPAAGYLGADSFTYAATDGTAQSNLATVAITVVNRAPVAASDTASTNRTAPVTIGVLANDSDPDGDALAVTALSTPANGTVVKNADGTITYTAKSGFVGTDTFTYQATDGVANSNTATVTVQVAALTNSAPVAKNDSASTTKGLAVSIAALANDTDPDGDLLSVKGFLRRLTGL